MIAKDDRIKGIIIYKVREVKNNISKLDSKTLYIDELAVDEEYRGNGIGRLLLNKMKEIARQEKCDSIELNCWSFNKRAYIIIES